MLLDTHVLLWFVLGSTSRISAAMRTAIEEAGQPVLVSALSFWEVAIKKALGKLDAPDDLPERVVALGFRVLDISAEHAWAVRALPPHHGDPFDRLLVAQAQVERLTIVSADPAFAAYGVPVLWDD